MDEQREREQAFLMRLWAAAEAAGLNQKALAAEIGIEAPTLSRLKSGQMARGRKGLSLRVVSGAVGRFPDLALHLPVKLPIGLAILPTSRTEERAS